MIRRLTALTVPALVLCAFFPRPAHAEIVTLGLKCPGREVVRCAYMHYDSVNDVLRGYATATDTGGLTDWEVAVNDLRLQRSPTGASGTWTTVAEGGDFDGYQPTDDFANTTLAPCIHNYYYRVFYHWSAKAGSTTASGDDVSDRAVPC
jgi:hypothetical protein